MIVTEPENIKLHCDTGGRLLFQRNPSGMHEASKNSFFSLSHHCISADINWLGAETVGEIHAAVQHLRADGA